MSKKKSNNSKKEKVNSTRKINKSDISENELLNEEKKSSSFEEQINIEKNKFLRLFAEFENYKKRTARERIELFSTASEEVMTSLLPILDDFDRASAEIEKNKDDEIFKGIILIQNKFTDALKSKGLSLIEVKEGDEFSADDHEAVTQIEAPSAKLKGKIIDVIEKGYKLGDKIIRYPKVVIGK